MTCGLPPTVENHCPIGTNDTYVVLSESHRVLSVAYGTYAHKVLMEPFDDVA